MPCLSLGFGLRLGLHRRAATGSLEWKPMHRGVGGTARPNLLRNEKHGAEQSGRQWGGC